MLNKHPLKTLFVLAVILGTTGCLLFPQQTSQPTPIPPLLPTQGLAATTLAPASTQTLLENTATPILSLAPTPTATSTPAIAPSPTAPPNETFIAYVQNGSLLVTHIMSGKPLETHEVVKTQYSGDFQKLGWSPSGEYLTYVMQPDNLPHAYLVNVKQGGKPIDLGVVDVAFGNSWAWSPDSKLLAIMHEYELWLYSPATGTKKQLTTHLGTNWLWSLPVFTPDGKSLWAVGTDSNHMDFHGTTPYQLYRIPLDGSAASDYPPGSLASVTAETTGILPLDLRFSPDGQKLAIITSQFIENCAQKTIYQVGNPDGKSFHDLPIPSLAAPASANPTSFFYGDSLVWDPQSAGLWVTGAVRDCSNATSVAIGPQLSYLTLDGQEQAKIPGDFSHLSIDRSGALLGVLNSEDSHVQILGRDGHLVLDLGEGDLPALQP
jgi:hypothetical protein